VVATEAGGPEADLDFERLALGIPPTAIDVDDDALAVLIFTSGTAGSRARPCSATATCWPTSPGPVGPGQVHLRRRRLRRAADVPHLRLNVVLALSLINGATIVLVQRFDPSTALDTIRRASGDDHPRRAASVVGVQPLRRRSGRQLRNRSARTHRRGEDAGGGDAKVARMFGLQLAEGYG
jgi:hypothetical protein